MKKILVSINGTTPFVTSKRTDIEALFEQMGYIRNVFHKVPDCFFTVTYKEKTTTVDFNYFDKLAKLAFDKNIVCINKMVDLLLENINK